MEMNKVYDWKSAHHGLWAVLRFGVALVLLFGMLVFSVFLLALGNTPAGQAIGQTISGLFAGDLPNVTWYITRAAGLTAYLLLWLSTVWGLVLPSRILEGKLHGLYTFDFHEVISLLAIGFIAIHMIVLLADNFMPFTITQLFIPFIAPYRPLWVGFGIISFYLIILVTVTFYIRDRIGTKTFRAIHVFSLLAFLGVAAHGLLSGTDSVLFSVQLMYAITFLSVVFLTTYWLVVQWMKKRSLPAKPPVGNLTNQKAHR